MAVQVCYMMLVQDEKAEEARTVRELNRPHPGLHGLLKKGRGGEDEGDSLLGGADHRDEEELEGRGEEDDDKEEDGEEEEDFGVELTV